MILDMFMLICTVILVCLSILFHLSIGYVISYMADGFDRVDVGALVFTIGMEFISLYLLYQVTVN